MFTVVCVVGARPNFVKIAPIIHSFNAHHDLMSSVLVHTGQHYDNAMSDIFFQQLDIRRPDVHLNVGPGSHGQQTGRVLARFEEWLRAAQPATGRHARRRRRKFHHGVALASVKLHIPVIHVEAGLRSFDRSMPEEINRLVTDSISDLLLVSANLAASTISDLKGGPGRQWPWLET